MTDFFEKMSTEGFNKVYHLLMVDTDFIFRRIMNKFKERPLLFSFLCTLLFSVPIPIIGFFENVLVNPELTTDMAKDVGFWLGYFGAIPFFSYYSIKYYNTIPRMFYSFYKNKIIRMENKDITIEFNTFIKKVYTTYNNKVVWVLIFIVPIILFFMSLFSFNLVTIHTWHRPDPGGQITLSNIVSIPGILIAFYFITQFAIRLFLGCYFIISFFRTFRMNIRVLHPDKCGGLGFVGNVAKSMNMMIFLMGIIIAGGLYNNIVLYKMPIYHPLTVIMILSYLTMASVIVLSPLYAAHKQMLKAKNDFLTLLNNEFEVVNDHAKTSISESNGLTREHLEKLKNITEYYEILEKQPIWPFNVEVIVGFIAAIAPILAFVAQSVISLLLN